MTLVYICAGAALGILATLVVLWAQQFHGSAVQKQTEDELNRERKKCQNCGKPTESKDIDGKLCCHSCFTSRVYGKNN